MFDLWIQSEINNKGEIKMKKSISIFLSSVFLLLFPTHAFAANAQNITVTSETSIIYAEPSTQSDKLATVKEGYSFTATGFTKSFWKLNFKFKNDDTVYTGYILKENTDTDSIDIIKESGWGVGASSASKPGAPATSKPSSSSNSSNRQSLSTVYWTSGGEVYHATSGCRSLARSKNIYSGTIAESGKSRGCNNCVK